MNFVFDREKTIAAIGYLAAKGLPELDKYRVCKLLFLADKVHLVKYARPITGDTYYAVQYGPIPTNILTLLTAFENNETQLEVVGIEMRGVRPNYKLKNPVDTSVLSKSDITVLDKVVDQYGLKSFGELKDLTHDMPAYTKAWNTRPNGLQREVMQFEDFFEGEPEAVKGALARAKEDAELRKSANAN